MNNAIQIKNKEYCFLQYGNVKLNNTGMICFELSKKEDIQALINRLELLKEKTNE